MCVNAAVASAHTCTFCSWVLRYFMALIQEMAVKIDQDFLAAMLALFTPVTDGQADRQKVKQGDGSALVHRKRSETC